MKLIQELGITQLHPTTHNFTEHQRAQRLAQSEKCGMIGFLTCSLCEAEFIQQVLEPLHPLRGRAVHARRKPLCEVLQRLKQALGSFALRGRKGRQILVAPLWIRICLGQSRECLLPLIHPFHHLSGMAGSIKRNRLRWLQAPRGKFEVGRAGGLQRQAARPTRTAEFEQVEQCSDGWCFVQRLAVGKP